MSELRNEEAPGVGNIRIYGKYRNAIPVKGLEYIGSNTNISKVCV